MKNCSTAKNEFLRLSDHWRLAFDNNQWIIQNYSGRKWRSLSFVGGFKRVLMRDLRRHGVKLDPDAHRIVAKLPDHFLDFIRNPNGYLIDELEGV